MVSRVICDWRVMISSCRSLAYDMSLWLSEKWVAFVSRSEDQVGLLMAAVLNQLEEGAGGSKWGRGGRSRGGTVVCEEDPEPSNRKAALVVCKSVPRRSSMVGSWITIGILEPGKSGGARLRGGGRYPRMGCGLAASLPMSSNQVTIALIGDVGIIFGMPCIARPFDGASLSGVILDQLTGQVPVTSKNNFWTFSAVNAFFQGPSITSRNSPLEILAMLTWVHSSITSS